MHRLAVTLMMLPGACAMGVSNTCPALYSYTDSEQSQAANELEAMPAGAVIPRMMGDYAATRNQIRVCRGEKAT